MIFESQLRASKRPSARPAPPSRLLQRKCACGGTPGPSGECAACEQKRHAGQSLQPKLSINAPGDKYEQEADRVADAVVGGGSAIVSSRASTAVQRKDDPPKEKTQEENYQDAAKKAGEAFLATPSGKEIAKKADELGDAFISTLPGKIITGAAIAGAVATFAATHRAFPIGIPEIPLDRIKPGLKMKITYEGPVDQPTKVMAGFSFKFAGGKAGKKKPAKTETEKYRAKAVRMAGEAPKTDDDKASEKRMMDAYIGSKILSPRQLTPRTEPLSFGAAGRDFGIKPEGPAAGGRRGLGPYSPDFKLAGEAPAGTPAVQEEAKKEEEETVQRKPAGGHAVASAPSIVNEVLQESGQPLDPATRAFMEERFGHDFGAVRIHRDPLAARSARAVSALAYTVGRDIVFAEGQFAPHSLEGQRLLAHELTHTVQQEAAPSQTAEASVTAAVNDLAGEKKVFASQKAAENPITRLDRHHEL